MLFRLRTSRSTQTRTFRQRHAMGLSPFGPLAVLARSDLSVIALFSDVLANCTREAIFSWHSSQGSCCQTSGAGSPNKSPHPARTALRLTPIRQSGSGSSALPCSAPPAEPIRRVVEEAQHVEDVDAPNAHELQAQSHSPAEKFVVGDLTRSLSVTERAAVESLRTWKDHPAPERCFQTTTANKTEANSSRACDTESPITKPRFTTSDVLQATSYASTWRTECRAPPLQGEASVSTTHSLCDEMRLTSRRGHPRK